MGLDESIAHARALYSVIGEICHNSGIVEGDLEKSTMIEQSIRRQLRFCPRPQFYEVLSYVAWECHKYSPITARDHIQMLLAKRSQHEN